MNILALLTKDDIPYSKRIRNFLPIEGKHYGTSLKDVQFIAEIEEAASNYDAIITTDSRIASLLLKTKVKASNEDGQGATINDYAGSLIKLHSGKEVVIINPLQHLVTTDTGEFLLKRYISKVVNPEKWWKTTEFNWAVADTPSKLEEMLTHCATSKYLALDIETGGEGKINVLGVCAIHLVDGEYTTFSYVIPSSNELCVDYWLKVCSLPQDKIFQNGLFDTTHLLTWGIPVTNWLWDTLGLFHSWYSELPKRLDFIASFLLRDAVYWKDEGKSSNLEEYYRYNAKDTWVTANAFLAWFKEAPPWAKKNYRIKFPEVFPCLQCNMEGLEVDHEAKTKMALDQTAILDRELQNIRESLGYPDFNPSSPKQVLQLLHLIGVKTAKDSSEKTLLKAAKTNPLASYYVGKILEVRGAKKLLTTYIESPLIGNRFLYSLNPFGTDTGRMASKKSNLYFMKGSVFKGYGQQIQNLPEYAKKMLKADKGFLLCEIDKKSSESYCTAALSQDPKLWEVVHTAPDFHCYNTSLFTGIPFEELYDATTGKVLQKDLRTLFKRVNHGYNYNMGEEVLIETMGIENIWKAKYLLLEGFKKYGNSEKYAELFSCLTAQSVAQFLLRLIDAVYPYIKKKWYPEIIREIVTTKMLTNPSGWTRFCFGHPESNKLALNAYAAHGAQHLSVAMVNISFIEIWREMQSADFHLKAQIHDSIFFQYRIGREDLVWEAEKRMQVKVVVHGKELVIPNDVTMGKEFWK